MDTNETNYIGTATYSPEDNKLRIYPFSRLDPKTYERVKAAGYSWAPKQELFVAPMWTPGRADLTEELCGDIGDESVSMAERATERSARFKEYSEKREADADRAKAGVDSITRHIPLGQPILIGHHSERRARKDAEKIQNGMDRAVKMWETSKYWIERAAGARAHADYKAEPDVRARRIKGLEADLRKQQRNIAEFKRNADLWDSVMELPEEKRMERAIAIAGGSSGGDIKLRRKEGDRKDFDQRPSAYAALTNSYPNLYAPRTLEEVLEAAKEVYPRSITHCARWVEHYTNRLAYEKAMLDDAGASHLLEKKKRPTQLPICNYKAATITYPSVYHRGEFETVKQVTMTQAEYAAINSDYKGTRVVENSHRVRVAYVRNNGERSMFAIFLTDGKVHEKPAPVTPTPQPPMIAPVYTPKPVDPKDEQFRALKDQAKVGVKIVTANQLFPTPPELAKRMMNAGQIMAGQRILEPSAGTGNLITAIRDRCTGHDCFRLVAVELHLGLIAGLKDLRNRSLYANEQNFQIIDGDFLEIEGLELRSFDRVVMNPPFENGLDIKHIQRARSYLKPEGLLVAICADGPRQQSALRPICRSWESLGPSMFEDQGTSVRTALMVMTGHAN